MNATITKVQQRSWKLLDEFKAFAVRGNVVDLAVGVVIGSAFTTITTSLVKDIVMPPLGWLLSDVDFSNLYINLSGDYASLAEAQAAGAPTINYGLFLNALLNFLVISFVVFLSIKQINRLQRQEKQQPADPTDKNCSFCYMKVPTKATRCPYCTSILPAV